MDVGGNRAGGRFADDAMRRLRQSPVWWTLSVAGYVIGTGGAVYGLMSNYWDQRRISGTGRSVVEIVVALALIGIIWSLIDLEGRKSELREARARSATAYDALNAVDELNRWPVDNEDGALYDFAEDAVSMLADLMSSATGSRCRACVKSIEGLPLEGNDYLLIAQVVARNGGRLPGDASDLQIVDDNTALKHPVAYQEPYFSNDIKGDPNFKTSREGYAYRATICWPVILFNWGDDGSGYVPLVAAILCVDAEETNVFDRDRDAPVGWAIAHAVARHLERQSPPEEERVGGGEESDPAPAPTELLFLGQEGKGEP